MAPRVAPTPFDADNSSGSCMPAACNDWRFGVADSMLARVSLNPHQMPDIRLQASPQQPLLSISFFPWRGSPYTNRKDFPYSDRQRSATIEFARSIKERGSHGRDYYGGAGFGKARSASARRGCRGSQHGATDVEARGGVGLVRPAAAVRGGNGSVRECASFRA